MSQWFVINNIIEFTDRTRILVFNNFGIWDSKNKSDLSDNDTIQSPEDVDELDQVLPHKESLIIVKELLKREKHKKTKKIRYLVNEKLFTEIITKLNSRMVSNILGNLVQKGLVESAFDNEANDFVFWVKDDQKEKPETD